MNLQFTKRCLVGEPIAQRQAVEGLTPTSDMPIFNLKYFVIWLHVLYISVLLWYKYYYSMNETSKKRKNSRKQASARHVPDLAVGTEQTGKHKNVHKKSKNSIASLENNDSNAQLQCDSTNCILPLDQPQLLSPIQLATPCSEIGGDDNDVDSIEDYNNLNAAVHVSVSESPAQITPTQSAHLPICGLRCEDFVDPNIPIAPGFTTGHCFEFFVKVVFKVVSTLLANSLSRGSTNQPSPQEPTPTDTNNTSPKFTVRCHRWQKQHSKLA